MSAFSGLQKVGRAFMLPIAVLPAAGLLLGIGGAFSSTGTLAVFPALNIAFLQNVFHIMADIGVVVFANLPLLFAIAIPVGLAREDAGTAGLAGGLSFLVFHQAIHSILAVMGITPDTVSSLAPAMQAMYANVLGIFTLQMGVFGGIIVGFVAVWCHNKYKNKELPQVLAFFSGARFVPIVASLMTIFLAVVMVFLWPLIQEYFVAQLGRLVVGTGYVGTFIYGMIERALIPFGLHPIFYVPFWQTSLGGTMDVCGNVVTGAQNIFFAQLACPDVQHFEVVQGTRFMTGKFPFMMFGLPGAALAMYKMARPENKKLAGGLLLSAALTAFTTGITEPIEFSFLFVAPVLYGIHVVFAGLSFFLMHLFNVGVGMTFSGGVIDFTLFGLLQGMARTNWIWIPIVGVFYFFIYYFGFMFAIKKWNLPNTRSGRKLWGY